MKRPYLGGVWAVWTAAAASLGGCTGVELPALSAGASVAQSGSAFYQRGKAQLFELATFQNAVEASRRTAGAMALHELSSDERPGYAKLRYEDERGLTMTVTVDRRTATVTRLEASVGTFGNQALVTLFLARVRQALREDAAHDDGLSGGDDQRRADPG